MTWALTQAHRATERSQRSQRPKRRTWLLWFDALISLLVISTVVIVLSHVHRTSAQPSLTITVLWLALIVALWVSDVYSRSHRNNTARTVLRIWKVAVIVAAGILVAEALTGPWLRDRIPPLSVVLALATCAAAMMMSRVAVALRRDQGTAGTRVIVVGCGTVAKDVVSRLERIAGVEVMGLVDDGPCDPGVIGSTRQLPELCRTLKVQRVIVAFTNTGVEQLLPSLRALPNSVAVDVVPRYFELVGWGARLEDFAGMSLVTLSQGCDPVSRDRIKRAFDVVVASFTLLLVSPILAAASLLVLLTSGRPVLFRQDRLGRGRTPFRIMKLRTLKVDDGTGDAVSDAPLLHSDMVAGRTTPIGQFLRRTGIDELPQLFNILAGDMSLVGPRPFIPEECWTLTGLGERRFDVKPGMTGLWQVSGQHDLSHEELIRLDTYYVDTWRFSTDLRIMALTPTRLWQGGGDGIAKLALVPPEVLQRPTSAHASNTSTLAPEQTRQERTFEPSLEPSPT